ncbi:hypothetical protein ACOMHN_034519 [Nucella lapillus]
MKSKYDSTLKLLPIIIWILWFLPETETAGANLRGAGASFPNDVYQAWIPVYRSHRQPYVDLNMTYNPVGSGKGRALIVGDTGDVEYVGSDSLLTDSELQGRSDLITFPTMAGGAVLAYNLPECNDTLNLTRDHVVGIYNGTFRMWNESTLQEENPGCQLPEEKIQVLARRDASGTTRLFTEVLSSFSPDWQNNYSVFDSGKDDSTQGWKSGVIHMHGKGNNGMSALVTSLSYSIGYMAVSAAQSTGLSFARLQNRHGQFLLPSSEAIQMAMDSRADDNLTARLADGDLEGAYPLASYTFFIIYGSQMTDCSSAKELVRYVDWFLQTESARSDCEKLLMVPLSPTIRDRVLREVLHKVTCRGNNVWQQVLADKAQEAKEEETWVSVVAISVSLLALILGATAVYVAWHRYKLVRMIESDEWDIPIEDIVFFEDRQKGATAATTTSRITSVMLEKSCLSLGEIADGVEILAQLLQWPGKWQGNTVGVRLLEVKELKQVSRDLKRTMLWLRYHLQHANLVRFYGLTQLESHRYVIGQYCAKGPVMDILRNDKYNFNNDFKFSLAADIASGLAFLHTHSLVHGALTSASCLLDARWTVKVVDWELCRLLTVLQPKKSPLLSLVQSHIEEEERGSSAAAAAAFRRFWVAPEVLRADFMLTPSSAADVYSFGIILHEIYTREDPYVEVADTLTPQQVVRAVCSNHLRPEPTEDIPIPVRQVMEIAWSDSPAARPTFEQKTLPVIFQIVKMLRQSRSSRALTVLDNMMETMEEYTYHLEQQLEQRTTEVTLTKHNLRSYLGGSVPPHLVPLLVNGETTRVETLVQGRVYSHLGLVMVQMVGVGAAVLSGGGCVVGEVLEVLNSTCAAVDEVVQRYGAYRSGLHEETQTILLGLETETTILDQRCATAANLAFDLLDCVTNMALVTSGSRSGTVLSMRAGVNVGKVATGLVGGAVPKFVQLGEGVEEAKTLMSCSTAGRVRASRNVFSHLEKNLDFVMEEAGWIVCVGTEVESFWIRRPARKTTTSVPSDHSADSGIEVEKSPATTLLDTGKPSEMTDVSPDTAMAPGHAPPEEKESLEPPGNVVVTVQQGRGGSQHRQIHRQAGQTLSDITEEDEALHSPRLQRQLRRQESEHQSPPRLRSFAHYTTQTAVLQKQDEAYAEPKVHLASNATKLTPQQIRVMADTCDVSRKSHGQRNGRIPPTGGSTATGIVTTDSVHGRSAVEAEQSFRDLCVSTHSEGHLDSRNLSVSTNSKGHVDSMEQPSEQTEVVSVSSAEKIQPCPEMRPTHAVSPSSATTNSDVFDHSDAGSTLQTDSQSHKYFTTYSLGLSDADSVNNSGTAIDIKLISTQCPDLVTTRVLHQYDPHRPKDYAHPPLHVNTDFPEHTVDTAVQEHTSEASTTSQHSHSHHHISMSQRFHLLYPRHCNLISRSGSPDLPVPSQTVSLQMEDIFTLSEANTAPSFVSQNKSTSFVSNTRFDTPGSPHDLSPDQLDSLQHEFFHSDLHNNAAYAETSESQSELTSRTESLSSEEHLAVCDQKSPKKTKVKRGKKPPAGNLSFLLHRSDKKLRYSSPSGPTRGKSKPANKVFPSP